MHIGIITVRDRTYHPTRRLIEAAEQKGHRVSLIQPYHVWPTITGSRLTLVGDKPEGPIPDVVLPRQGAEITQSCRVLINQLLLMDIPLVNSLAAIRRASHQYLTLQTLTAAGVPVPDTLFINAAEGLQLWGAERGGFPVVVKEIDGRQGEGVVLVKNAPELAAAVQTRLQRSRGLLVQKFIPNEGRRDIRALVIGDRVAGAMTLTPSGDDFRANYHLGAAAAARALTDTETAVALAAARAVGLDIAGVDLIRDARDRVYVIEVNYAPGFRGLEKATGTDVAGLIIEHAAEIFRQHALRGSGS